jgi:hypothetical protein
MIFQYDYIEPEPETVLDKPPGDPQIGMMVDIEGPPGNFNEGRIISVVAQEHGPGQEPVSVLSIATTSADRAPEAIALMEWLVAQGEVAIKVVSPQEQHA